MQPFVLLIQRENKIISHIGRRGGYADTLCKGESSSRDVVAISVTTKCRSARQPVTLERLDTN